MNPLDDTIHSCMRCRGPLRFAGKLGALAAMRCRACGQYTYFAPTEVIDILEGSDTEVNNINKECTQ